jgi:peptidyl-prolyl cis-trans isomerase B (cyclophilin B)
MVKSRWAIALVLPLATLACGDSGSSGSDPQGTGPAMEIDAAKTYAATMVTAQGTIELSLDAKAAPITTNNFVVLARKKFYDGLVFWRVVPGFVIQGGDPQGDGSGGPGYTIPDEASGLLHEDGALAMAKSSTPNSAGSQFYITLGRQSELDGNYTVFGRVTSGKDVPGKIVADDKITSVTITEK